MIEAKDLSKSYRKKLAVDSISFRVESGKVTGFLGPNGAGKSTTMRLMLGLDNGGGVTTFDGKKLSQYKEPSKVVGILLEAKSFHPTRSARNHLRVLAAEGGISKKRVDEVLDIVGLSNVAKKSPGKFSLGMSQRLGIAAAILSDPKYLILDEPSNGLDPEGVAWLRQFLKDYARRDRAVFVSSHLLSEMQVLADNVVVIGKGKLIAETSIKQLTSDGTHASIFVRSPKLSLLERLLNGRKIIYAKSESGLKVSGVTTDQLGKLAFAAGIPILELTRHDASLEEVFLKMTEKEEEFASKTVVGGKK